MNMKQNNLGKQQLFIGATIQPIQNCQLLSSCDDCILFINKRSLIVMNLISKTLKSCLIDDQKIISATYYGKLEVFLINTDRHLLIVNKEAQIISNQRIPELLQAKSLIIIQMEDGYQGIPFQRKDLLLFFTNQYMFQVSIQVKYQRSLLKNKNLCSINIQFLQKPIIVHFEWTAQFVNLSKIRLLICWNQTQAFIFQTPKLLNQQISLIYNFDKILRKNKIYESQNKINSFQASLKHKLLVVAYQLGSIKVYKLDQTKKYICELKGHQRQCLSLFIPQESPDLLYSCGLDNSVRIWQLVDFGHVYHVRFDIICSQVQMLSQKLIFAKSVDNRRAFFVKLNIGLMKPILSQAKSGRLISLLSDGQWGISLYSNNFVEAFYLGNYNNQNREFTEKIEFPIKYGFLRSSMKLKTDTFAVCMQKGFSLVKLSKKQSQGQNFQLKRLVYNHTLSVKPNQKGKLIEMIHEKLLDSYFFSILVDWKNIPIAINVTSVSFLLDTYVPKWDIEIKSKQSLEKLDFIILGNDRGYIFFIDIKKRTHYHTRVYFHSDPIASVQRLKIKDREDLYFISMTNAKQIAIWSLSEHKSPNIYTRITYTKDISIIKTAQNFMAIGCKSGQFNVFRLQHNNQQLQFLESQSNKQDGHLKAIVGIDFIKYKQKDVWLTAGQDYAIKVWKGIQKQIIIEFRIFSAINYAIFSQRNLDIMISHGQNNQISVLTQNQIEQIQQSKTRLQNAKLEQAVTTSIDARNFFCPVVEYVSPSPKKKQKEYESPIKQNALKKSEINQLIKNRQTDNNDSFLFSSSQKKHHHKKGDLRYSKNLTPSKNVQYLNNSLILPKIKGNKMYLDSSILTQHKRRNQELLENSRTKSFSHAGKMKF